MKRFILKCIGSNPYVGTGEYYTGAVSCKGSLDIGDAKQFKSYKAAEKWVVNNTVAPLVPDPRPGRKGQFLPWGSGPKTDFEILEVEYNPVIVNVASRTVNFGTVAVNSNVGQLTMIQGQ